MRLMLIKAFLDLIHLLIHMKLYKAVEPVH